MLYASRALAGILSSATMPTAMAYISDSTPEEERGKGMGILGAAMGLGMVLGPGIGGWLAAGSLSTPFFLAAGLSVLTLGFVILFLPESLPSEIRSQPKGKFKGLQLRTMWNSLFGPIGILLLLAFLVSFGLTNFEAVFGLYALKRFEYGPEQVGTILTVIGLISAIAQGALTGPITKKWGEVLLIRVSLIGSAIGFGLMLLAFNYFTVLLTVSVFILSNAMLRPAITSLTSKETTIGQGIAMGLNNSYMSLGRIAGPITAGLLFDLHLSYPYFLGSVVMLIGFVISLVWLHAHTNLQPQIAD
jgi:DHA1 family multidrug resistance protein-like MFS transporter